MKTNQRRERRELQLRVGENEMRKKILGGGAVGASIYHGLHLTYKKRAKLAKTLAGYSILGMWKQGYLGAGRGRWVGPSIDQGWHLTRPLAPSGPSVIPCNGPTPDNDTRIGEANLFGPTHSSPTITMFVGHQSFHPHRVYHHLEPLIVEHHILSNGSVSGRNQKQGRVEDNQNQDHMGHRIGFEGR